MPAKKSAKTKKQRTLREPPSEAEAHRKRERREDAQAGRKGAPTEEAFRESKKTARKK